MVHVNKKYLDKQISAAGWNRLLAAIQNTKSEESLKKTLGSFFTESEITMLEKRLIIPILLERQISYRKIGQILDVSPGTISFIKRGLVKKPVVHRLYSSSNYKSKTRAPLPVLPPRVGHGRWLRSKLYGTEHK